MKPLVCPQGFHQPHASPSLFFLSYFLPPAAHIAHCFLRASEKQRAIPTAQQKDILLKKINSTKKICQKKQPKAT
ncbi:hypothetical protein MCERE19_03158 [Spirosomataceae bacterium]